MEFSPSLVGCVIASLNHSFEMIRRSRQCVINGLTADLIRTVIQVGNCSGDTIDKFAAFGLTPTPATDVKAPLLAKCPASFECRLADGRMVGKYNFFVFEIVRAHVARSPKYPKTIHYHGKGVFTLAGQQVNLNRLFTKCRDV
jgi:flavin reductase (DIM6/NTAB) family NADH-FMN oxidoreductase RutF